MDLNISSVHIYENSIIQPNKTYYALTSIAGEYYVYPNYQIVKNVYKNNKQFYINQPISITGIKLLKVIYYYENVYNLHNTYFPKHYKVAYVDGSCRPLSTFQHGGKGVAAWGGIVMSSGSDFSNGSTCINYNKFHNNESLVTSIEAECKAVEYIAQLFSSDNILFIGDCSSAKRYVDKTMEGVYTSLTKFINNRQFKYFLIPGHAGIKYNVMIDKFVNYTNRTIRDF